MSEWSLLTFPSPILELQDTPLPLKVLWVREHASTPPSSAVFYLDSHLNPSRSWECIPSFFCFLQGGIKVGPSYWKLDNSTTLSLEMTSRSWTWWSLPWVVEVIGTCKITHGRVKPFLVITTKPLNVERPTKIRTGPSLIRIARTLGVTRPTKTKAWQFLFKIIGPPEATRPTNTGARPFLARVV